LEALAADLGVRQTSRGKRDLRGQVRAIGLLAGFVAACGSAPSGEDARPRTPVPSAPVAVGAPAPSWYPMADSALPLPSTCSARCSLDCDVWSGEIECHGDDASIAVWGGLSSMAGMQLDGKTAKVEGQETLRDGARLRWGTTPGGDFCATVSWHPPAREAGDGLFWTWQLCAPDSASRRALILQITRGHTKAVPSERVLQCPNTGC
jgi:hypothetical protein